MKKIGFVFFEEIHMLHHFIGIASELYKKGEFEIDIITYKGEHEYLFKLMKLLNMPESIVKQVDTTYVRKISEKIRKRKMPSSKYLFSKNKKYLLNYDALVFTDINQEYLYDRRKNNSPKFIHAPHGAGDRAYPFIHKESTKFDLILAYGQSVIDNHKKYFDYKNTEFNIVGYPKYDVAELENKDLSFFNNDNPIILYNPHFEKDLSSWYTHGKKILDFFIKHNEYNLIFAPHINLFNKKGYLKREDFDRKYLNYENILVDLGSVRSVNMSYTLVSDLYLGDVSSQVIEFLVKQRRPCIFVNRIAENWQQEKSAPNSWKFGKIITEIDNLNKLIKERSIWHKDYIEIQNKTMNYLINFDQKKSSCLRAAEAITELLK